MLFYQLDLIRRARDLETECAVLIDTASLTQGFGNTMWAPQSRGRRRSRARKYHMYFLKTGPNAVQAALCGLSPFCSMTSKSSKRIITLQHSNTPNFPKYCLRLFHFDSACCGFGKTLQLSRSCFFLFYSYRFLYLPLARLLSFITCLRACVCVCSSNSERVIFSVDFQLYCISEQKRDKQFDRN